MGLASLAGLADRARTNTPIFRGFVAESAIESADSSPESADSTTDSMPVSILRVLNMLNICTLIQSAGFCRQPTAKHSSGYGA